MTQVALNRDCPLDENIRKNPFVVSLSNHELPFDKLRVNGFLANGQSRLNTYHIHKKGWRGLLTALSLFGAM